MRAARTKKKQYLPRTDVEIASLDDGSDVADRVLGRKVAVQLMDLLREHRIIGGTQPAHAVVNLRAIGITHTGRTYRYRDRQKHRHRGTESDRNEPLPECEDARSGCLASCSDRPSRSARRTSTENLGRGHQSREARLPRENSTYRGRC